MGKDLKIIGDENYQQWICNIAELVYVSQLKVAVQVNTEIIRMYWHIGKEISDKCADAIWGSGFYKTMGQFLKEEFPNVQGFLMTNLKDMKSLLNFINKPVRIVNSLLTIWKRFALYLVDIIF